MALPMPLPLDVHVVLDKLTADEFSDLDILDKTTAAKVLFSIAEHGQAAYSSLHYDVKEQYRTLHTCEDSLRKDDITYRQLVRSHRDRDYEYLRAQLFTPIIAPPNRPILPTKKPSPREETARTIESVTSYLDDKQVELSAYARGQTERAVWSPAAPAVQELSIPIASGEQNLFGHSIGKGVVEQERLDRVFSHARHCVLTSASGSWKTLIFEGLSSQFGLYTTCAASQGTTVGSGDLHRALAQRIPSTRGFVKNLWDSPSGDFSRALSSNRTIARRSICAVMMSRLLIFERFLRDCPSPLPSELATALKRRWLLLQLLPTELMGADIFVELSERLDDASDEYLMGMTILHERISARLGCPLFIVFDEAQYAAALHTTSFATDRRKARPVLRELVRFCDTYVPRATAVVCGTGISMDMVDEPDGSQFGKIQFSMVTDIGSLEDRKEVETSLRAYLLQDILQDSELHDKLCCWLLGL